MMELMQEKNKGGSDSFDEGLIWRAHADILSLSSHGMLLRRKENETTTVVEDEPTSMIGKETHDLLSMALKDYKVSNDGASGE